MRTFSTSKYIGRHISESIADAIKEANEYKDHVQFEFNDTTIIVGPGDSAEAIYRQWVDKRNAEQEKWRKSPEGQAHEKRQREEAEKLQKREEAGPAHDEEKLRELPCPKVTTPEELLQVVNTYLNGRHTYGTAAYAVAIVAEAAFNFMAREMGVTGFQAGFASMRLLGRIKQIDGPFMLIKASDALYRQYDPHGRLAEALEEWRPWLREEAKKRLANDANGAHPDVVARWRKLAAGGE